MSNPDDKIIIPTIGRKLYLCIDFSQVRSMRTESMLVLDRDQPLDATIIYVHPDKKGTDFFYITAEVVDHEGNHHALVVPLRQANQIQPDAREWAEWMPYQVGQAKKDSSDFGVSVTIDPVAQAEKNATMSAKVRSALEPAGITFGAALRHLKDGDKVSRQGWNGKGLWLELQRPDAGSKMTLPYIFMSYPADATNTPGARVPWLASQTDMLAEDWVVIL